MNTKTKVKRVKTIWGKLCFVREDELNSDCEQLHICNQFGAFRKLPLSKGWFTFAPASVYRDNLLSH